MSLFQECQRRKWNGKGRPRAGYSPTPFAGERKHELETLAKHSASTARRHGRPESNARRGVKANAAGVFDTWKRLLLSA